MPLYNSESEKIEIIYNAESQELQMLRRKDPYMKIYETMIKGKRQIVWQILH